MFKKILMATDFSNASKTALDAAIHLCRVSGAALDVIHVLPKMEGRLYKVMLHLAEKDMRAFFGFRRRGNNQTKILFCDSIPEAILSYAKKRRCELIVLGSKDRSGIGDVLSGSVITHLTKISTIPMMLVNNAPKKSTHKIRNILVPFDFSLLSKKTLSYAIRLTKGFSAKLHVVYVLDSRIAFYSVQLDSLLHQAEVKLQKLTANRAKTSRIASRQIQGLVLAGNPTEELRKYARKNRIDLVVVGTHPSKGLAGVLLKSIASTVLSKTKTPEIVLSSRSL